MDDQPTRERITYEYRVEDTPRYCVVEEEWELYDVFPAKWNPGNKVLVFRRECQNELNKANAIQNAFGAHTPPSNPNPAQYKLNGEK